MCVLSIVFQKDMGNVFTGNAVVPTEWVLVMIQSGPEEFEFVMTRS